MTARGSRLGLARAFASAAASYWLHVFPLVRREFHYWRSRAAAIPDPTLRTLALDAYDSKWCNLEGAAAFATLAPARSRRVLVRLLFTFQAAYDFADLVSERPQTDPVANGRQLHQPLLVALRGATEHPDYFLHSDLRDDGGYLEALTDACRDAFAQMPSGELVKEAAVRAAERIVVYQSLSHAGQRMRAALERWSAQQVSPGSGVLWWEAAAACASSLTVLALLSAAAHPKLTVAEVSAIEHVYYPWVGALHTLLDSLVDWHEDKLAGQPTLLDEHPIGELAERMRMLTRRSRQSVRLLPAARRHEIVLAGMVAVYLAMPQAQSIRASNITTGIRQEMGSLARPTLAVIGLRRRVRVANGADLKDTAYT